MHSTYIHNEDSASFDKQQWVYVVFLTYRAREVKIYGVSINNKTQTRKF